MTAKPAERTREKTVGRSLAGRDFESQDARFGLLLVLPALMWVAIVVLLPMVTGIQTSLTDQQTPGTDADFVGLANYTTMMGDSGFRGSLGRSALWVVANGVLQTLLALGVALLLNRPFRGMAFVRSWIVLPWVVPAAVIAILWKWMLDASSGIVNQLLVGSGIRDEPILFLAQQSTAFPSLIAINSWRFFPFLAIILLAALQSVPEEEYEAARVDGGSAWMQFRAITLPHITPTLAVLGLVGTLWAANVFDLIWMVTNGGPVNSTETSPLFIYETAFSAFNISAASTASVLLLLALAAFAIGFSILVRKQLSQIDETLEDVVAEADKT